MLGHHAVISNTANTLWPGRRVWIFGAAQPALNKTFLVTQRVNTGEAALDVSDVPDGTYSEPTLRVVPFQQLTIGGLEQATTYCYAIMDASGMLASEVREVTTTSAHNSVSDGPEVVSASGSDFRPLPPIPPIPYEISPSPPPITGGQFQVAANCSNLQDMMNQAALAADRDGLTQVVLIPKTKCSGTYLLSPRDMNSSTGGWVILRPAVSDASLPPPGVRATPLWAGKMATMQTNKIGGRIDFPALRTDFNKPTKRWWIMGLEFSHEDTCDGCRTIKSVSNSTPLVVTTTEPHGYQNNDNIQIFGILGVPGANGSKRVKITGPDTFEIVGSSAGGDYTGGGQIAKDPRTWDLLVSLNTGSEEIVLDRVLIHGRGFPSRGWFGLNLHCRRCGIVNSSVYEINNWRGVAPGATSFTPSGGIQTCVDIDITGGHELTITNTYIEGVGILVFAQEGGSPGTSDVVFRRNLVETLDQHRFHPLNSSSNGRWHVQRQQFECKTCKGLWMDGNIFVGNFADAAWPGPTINLSSRGLASAANTISDVHIGNNLVYNTSGGFQLSGTDTSNLNDTFMSQRIRLKNNLFFKADGRRCASITTARNCAGDAQVRGFQIALGHGISDLLIENNTMWDFRGSGPFVLFLGGRKSSRTVVRKNIFSLNYDGGLGGFITDAQVNTFLPPLTNSTNPQSLWNQWFSVDGQPDRNSRFEDNVLVPGVRDTFNPAAYNSADTKLNFNRFACESPTVNTAFSSFLSNGNTCVGANTQNNGTESAAARFNQVGFVSIEPGMENFELRSDSAYKSLLPDGATRDDPGINMSALKKALGVVSDVKVTAVRENTGRLSMMFRYVLADETQRCTIEYGAGLVVPGNGMRVNDSGVGSSRRVIVTNLQPETTYGAWILCPNQQIATTAITGR